MSKTERFQFVFNLINEFTLENNSDKAIVSLLGALCSGYNFDLASTYYYDRVHNKFSWIASGKPKSDSKGYDIEYSKLHSRLNLRHYSIHMAQCHSDFESGISEIFKENHFIYARNMSDFKEVFEKLDFVPNEPTKQVVIYGLFDCDLTLGYVALEKADESCLIEADLEDVLLLLNLFNRRVQDVERIKEFEKKYRIEKIVAETTGFDRKLLVVEKSTNNIFYHNNCIPELERGGVIQRRPSKDVLDGKVGSNEVSPLYVAPDFIRVGEYGKFGEFIVRTSEISWLDDKDAYIISIINADQFAKEKLAKDRLTGAYTWFGIKEKIRNDGDKTKGRDFAYVSVDIEKLKLINDEHTRDTGDRLLREICAVMEDFIESDEYCCRVVADTFAVIINYVDDAILESRVNSLGDRLAKMFRQILPEKSIVATGGVCIIKGDLHKQLESGFENTRIARSTIKGSYKNGFALFTDDLRTKLKEKKHIEDKVSSAIDNNEFSVYLQPKFNLNTREVVGAEALVRWISVNETIYPDNFIPVFEKNGFVRTLDFIVYEKVFQFIRDCLDKNIKMVPISINMSRNHLEDDQFLEKLLNLIEDYDVPRYLVEVEITENASAQSDYKLREFVERIKEENITVSMDDFGAAYSSLSLLKTLQIDTLKLDKEFLDKMNQSKEADVLARDEIIIKNIVNMAKELEFNVICEGIETEAQLEFLRTIGCDHGQGYIFSKPLPLEDFLERYSK